MGKRRALWTAVSATCAVPSLSALGGLLPLSGPPGCHPLPPLCVRLPGPPDSVPRILTLALDSLYCLTTQCDLSGMRAKD